MRAAAGALELTCDSGPGFSPRVSATRGLVLVRKRVVEVQVEFAETTGVIQTLEGAVEAEPGDAVITGVQGERWPVSAGWFVLRYESVPPLRQGQKDRYRSRPVEVHAGPMREAFASRLGHRESVLQGARGDWLIDCGHGGLGVVDPMAFSAAYEVQA